MTWFIYILFFISVVMIILAFARPQSKEEANARLQYLKAKKQARAQETLDSKARAFGQSLAEEKESLIPLAAKLIPEGMRDNFRTKLDKAGLYSTSIEQYAVNQLLAMVGFPLLFIILNLLLMRYDLQVVMYALPTLTLLGYYYPIIRLNTQIEQRQRAIFRSFPSMIDLLTVCLEAGMGIDASLNVVSQKGPDGPFKEELQKTLREIKVGKPRVQALKDMSRRVDMKEVTTFVVAVAQAEQIGGNLSQTLKVQSEIAREARWQKAQELAQKAPVKLLFPMVILIFPNIFLIIFGPIVLQFIVGRL